MIMTATLKGPLEGTSWENPWVKKKSPRLTRKFKDPVPESEKTQHELVQKFVANAQPLENAFKSPTAKRRHIDRESCSLDAVCVETPDLGIKNRRVEDWLRTNSAYVDTGKSDQASSPTVSKSRTIKKGFLNRSLGGPDHRLDPATPSKRDLRDPNPETLEDNRQKPTEMHELIQDKFPNLRSSQQRLPAENPSNVSVERVERVSKHAADSKRAEYAILRNVRRGAHTMSHLKDVSQAKNQNISSKGRGDKARIRNESKHQTSHERCSTTQSQAREVVDPREVKDRSSETAGQGVLLGDHGTGRTTNQSNQIVNVSNTPEQSQPGMPPPETSITSVSNVLPSAQVVLDSFLKPSISIPSNGDKLEEPHSAPLTDAHVLNRVGEADVSSRKTSKFSDETPTKLMSAIGVHNSSRQEEPQHFQSRPPPFSPRSVSPVEKCNTQQVIASMSPPGFGTVKKDMRKPSQRKGSTQTKVNRLGKVTKSNATPKRASFSKDLNSITSSPDVSQGSIKSALKVAKTAALDPVKPGKLMANEPEKIAQSNTQIPSKYDGKCSVVVDGNGSNPTPLEKDSSKINPKSSSIDAFLDTAGAGQRPDDLNASLENDRLYSDLHSVPPADTKNINNNTGGTITSAAIPQSHQMDPNAIPFQPVPLDEQEKLPEEPVYEPEEEFDLAAAIDDLGSYLGSWDKEQAEAGAVY